MVIKGRDRKSREKKTERRERGFGGLKDNSNHSRWFWVMVAREKY